MLKPLEDCCHISVMGVHGPTFAATVGRKKTCRSDAFVLGSWGGFSPKKWMSFGPPPNTLVKLDKFLLQFFPTWLDVGIKVSGISMIWRYIQSTHILQQAVKECSLLFIPIGGNGEWAGLLENEKFSKSTGNNSLMRTQDADSG